MKLHSMTNYIMNNSVRCILRPQTLHRYRKGGKEKQKGLKQQIFVIYAEIYSSSIPGKQHPLYLLQLARSIIFHSPLNINQACWYFLNFSYLIYDSCTEPRPLSLALSLSPFKALKPLFWVTIIILSMFLVFCVFI